MTLNVYKDTNCKPFNYFYAFEKNNNFAHNRKTLPNFIIVTYPPIFESPQPPGQALTNDGSAKRATGLNVPVLKYGPTGDKITYNRADKDLLTPRAG